jgi:toxin ParE1/3/4
MTFEVVITTGAERDLAELDAYIAQHDSPGNADHVLDQLLRVIDRLAHFPERGVCPSELAELGAREFRQVFFKPYRVIYRIHGKRVFVVVIADGRRDMRTLLMQRLL